MGLQGITFPVICKPLEACGTPQSHLMMVLVSATDLTLLTTPCVLQQYHNHSGVFFKVYVIDKEVMFFRRPSLPNLPAKDIQSVVFDSRHSYPTLDDFMCLSPPADADNEKSKDGEEKDECQKKQQETKSDYFGELS
jgi:hypothetical protein